MFEDSLVESSGRLKTKSKYWTILTFFMVSSVFAVMILIPLIYPEALPKTAMTAMLTAPPPPPPPPPPQVKVAAVKIVQMDNTFHAPTKIPHDIKEVHEEAAPSDSVAGMSGMGGPGGALGGIMGALGTGPAIAVVKAKPAGPLRVSSGVAAGNRIGGSDPIYPPIAKAAHVQGAVVLHAIISKTGTIENLTVLSGPVMLRQAALDAIKNWRYKPYLLNGEPTEVDTQITVNFTNGG